MADADGPILPLLNQAAGWLGECAFEHDEKAKLERDEAEALALRQQAENYRTAAFTLRAAFNIPDEQ